MLNVKQRLEFSDVYSQEEPEELLVYLKKISRGTILKIIGFSNTNPQPNYDTVFSNPTLRNEVIARVTFYQYKNNIEEKPELVSRLASLKIAEKILSNNVLLIEQNTNAESVDVDEENLFKAYLVVNTELNKNNIPVNASDKYRKIC